MKKIIILSLILFLLFINAAFGAKSSLNDDCKGECCYNSGNLYFEKKNYPRTIKFYEKAISDGYKHNDMYYKLSICYKEVKNYIKSIYCLDKAIALLEKKVQALINTPSFLKDITPLTKPKPASTPVTIPLGR